MSLINIKQIRNLPQASAQATILYDGISNVWSNNATGGLKLPVGTTLERPSNQGGVIRFNSTTGVLEYNTGTIWQVPFVSATTASGTTLIQSQTSGVLQLRGITGQGVVEVRVATSAIIVSAPRAVITTSSRGTGVSISPTVSVSAVTSNRNELIFRSILGAGSIQVSAGLNEITLSAPVYNQVSALSQLTNNVGFITENSALTLINNQGFVSAGQFTGGGIIQINVSGNEVRISAASTQVAVQASSLGTGTSVIIGTSANETSFRTFLGSGSIQVSAGVNEIVLSAPVIDLSPYITQASANLAYQAAGSLSSLSQFTNTPGFTSAAQFVGAGIIQVRVSGTGAGQQIIVSAAPTQVAVQANNLGTGEIIAVATSGLETRFRSIRVEGALQLSASPIELVLSAAPNPTQLSQLVNNVGFITESSALTLINAINQVSALSQLTNNVGFLSAANFIGGGIIDVRVSGTTNGRQIFISAASTQVAVQASSLGTGTSVIIGTSANEIRFRTFVGSGSIQVSAGVNEIILSAPVYNQVSALSQLTNNVGYITQSSANAAYQPLGSLSALSQFTNNQGFVSANQIIGAGIIQVRVSGTGAGQQIIVSAASTTQPREMVTIVNQTAHGFTQGQIVYLDDDDNTWKLAIATSADTLGVAMVETINANSFTAIYGGVITGLSGLIPGQYYFTSPITPGALTITEPQAPQIANPMLHAITSTTGIVLPYRPNVQTSAAGGLGALSVTNLGGGQEIALLVSANRDFNFRTLTGAGGIDVRTNGNTVIVSAPAINLAPYITQTSANAAYQPLGSLSALSQFSNNVGYITQTSANIAFQAAGSISALSQLTNNTGFLSAANFIGGGIIDVRVSGTTNGRQIFISAARTLTVSALGTGAQIIESVSGNSEIRFRTITTNTGNGITVVTSGNNIEIRSSAITQGRHTLWQPAGSMVGKITGGADFSAIEVGTNQIVMPTYDFDPNTIETVQFTVAMPKSWDEGSLVFQFYWTYNVAGAGNVIWRVRAIAFSDDDLIGGGTWGTQVSVTDTSLGVVNDLHISPETAAVNVGNTPINDDMVVFEISRDASNVGDTFPQDAKLLGVKIFYNVNAPNDA